MGTKTNERTERRGRPGFGRTAAGALALALAVGCAALAGCGTGPRAGRDAAREALLGRWFLTEHVMRYAMGGAERVAAFRPGDALWWSEYYVEFGADGTFRELNFWTPEAPADGTWELSDGTLTLALDALWGGAIPFVGTRHVEIAADGSTMTMRYSRPFPFAEAGSWDYVATFGRTAPRPPELDGYGGGADGPLIGAWRLDDVIGVSLDFVIADGAEFFADGTGLWISNPAHLLPGFFPPGLDFDPETGMYVGPFEWASRDGVATIRAFGQTNPARYEVSGDVKAILFDDGSRAVFRRVGPGRAGP